MPATLVGWSMGGVVAHEMAGQMVSAGLSAPMVVMLDTHVPHTVSHQAASAASIAATLAAELGMVDTTMVWDQQLGIQGLHEKLTQAGVLADDIDPTQLQRRFDLIQHHMTILAKHVVRPVPVTALLFKAMTSIQPRHDNGWTPYVRSLRVVPNIADHFTMMRLPHVERLARELALHLSAESPEGSGQAPAEVTAHVD